MEKRFSKFCVASLLALSVVVPVSTVMVKNSLNSRVVANDPKADLMFPINGEEVNILKPSIADYVDAMHKQAEPIKDDQLLHDFYVMAPDTTSRHYGETFTNETDLVRVNTFTNNSNIQKSKKVMLTFLGNGTEPNKVIISEKIDMSDAIEITNLEHVNDSYYVGVNQLYSGKTYYWQAFKDGTSVSDVASFKTAQGFRMITTNSVTNVRDMGGRTVKLKTGVDGEGNNVYVTKRIKQGLIFRGGELVEEDYVPTDSSSTHHATLKTGDAELFVEKLNIGLEIDFRGAAESGDLTESPLKSYYRKNYSEEKDINYLRLDNMSAYDDFMSISSSKSYYPDIKNMFKAFANANERHVYFHCWGGADRTGTCGFLLGALLGMSLTDLIIDYELTSFSNNYRPHDSNDAKKVYRFPSLLRKVLELNKKGKSETYWEENKPLSQIIEEILIDRFEVTSEDIASIRANLLED